MRLSRVSKHDRLSIFKSAAHTVLPEEINDVVCIDLLNFTTVTKFVSLVRIKIIVHSQVLPPSLELQKSKFQAKTYIIFVSC